MTQDDEWKKYDKLFYKKYAVKTELMLNRMLYKGFSESAGSYGRVYFFLQCLYKLGVKL